MSSPPRSGATAFTWGGEVKSPGLIPMNGRMTALEAIMQAGGYDKHSAKMSTVVIVRQREGGAIRVHGGPQEGAARAQ